MSANSLFFISVSNGTGLPKKQLDCREPSMSCMAGVVRTPTLKKELEKLNDWESVLTKSELKTERNKLFAENKARHALAEIQPLPQPPATQPPSSPPGPSPPTPTKETPPSSRDPAKDSSSWSPSPADADASQSMLSRESATAKKTEPVETPSNQISNSLQILCERHEIYEPSFDVREFGKQLGMDIADLNESATAKKKTEPVGLTKAQILLRERHEIFEVGFDIEEYLKQLEMDIADLNEKKIAELEKKNAELEKQNAAIKKELQEKDAIANDLEETKKLCISRKTRSSRK